MYTDYLLNELKTNSKNNLDKYNDEHSFVKSLCNNYDLELYNLDKDVVFPTLDNTIATKENQKNQWEIDCNNSIKLHKEFVQNYDIGLDILSDERFIAYLTHDVYYDYMRNRWPVNGKENRILQKYFLPSGSQGFTRNMFLRLFWYAWITYDKNLDDPYELTKVAFEYADPVNQIMERKYGRNERIVTFGLKDALVYSYLKDIRFVLLVCLLIGFSVWWATLTEQILQKPMAVCWPDVARAVKENLIQIQNIHNVMKL